MNRRDGFDKRIIGTVVLGVFLCVCIYNCLTMSISFAARYQGSYGRLIIPDDRISVKVNNERSGSNQSICDKPNSALYAELDELRLIADHDGQGFARLKRSIPGKTKAYLAKGDVIETYVCKKIIHGHNTVYEITDNNYNPIVWDHSGFITYTCNGSWQNVLIVYWSKC